MKEFYLVPKHVAQHWKTDTNYQEHEKNNDILKKKKEFDK